MCINVIKTLCKMTVRIEKNPNVEVVVSDGALFTRTSVLFEFLKLANFVEFQLFLKNKQNFSSGRTKFFA